MVEGRSESGVDSQRGNRETGNEDGRQETGVWVPQVEALTYKMLGALDISLICHLTCHLKIIWTCVTYNFLPSHH